MKLPFQAPFAAAGPAQSLVSRCISPSHLYFFISHVAHGPHGASLVSGSAPPLLLSFRALACSAAARSRCPSFRLVCSFRRVSNVRLQNSFLAASSRRCPRCRCETHNPPKHGGTVVSDGGDRVVIANNDSTVAISLGCPHHSRTWCPPYFRQLACSLLRHYSHRRTWKKRAKS